MVVKANRDSTYQVLMKVLTIVPKYYLINRRYNYLNVQEFSYFWSKKINSIFRSKARKCRTFLFIRKTFIKGTWPGAKNRKSYLCAGHSTGGVLCTLSHVRTLQGRMDYSEHWR